MTKKEGLSPSRVLRLMLDFHYATMERRRKLWRNWSVHCTSIPKAKRRDITLKDWSIWNEEDHQENPSLSELPFLKDPTLRWMKILEFKVDQVWNVRQLKINRIWKWFGDCLSGNLRMCLLKPSDDMGQMDCGWVFKMEALHCSMEWNSTTSYKFREAQTKNQRKPTWTCVYGWFGKIRPKFKKIIRIYEVFPWSVGRNYIK